MDSYIPHTLPTAFIHIFIDSDHSLIFILSPPKENLENNIHRLKTQTTRSTLKRIPKDIYDKPDKKIKIYDSKHET